MAQNTYLLLGFGYTASFLEKYIAQADPKSKIFKTSRLNPDFIHFDLKEDKTWNQLPTADYTFWTFPATPFEQVKKFYSQWGQSLGHLTVVGSTSALKVQESNQRVDEKTELDLSQDRVRGEEFLRSQGATTVLSSGIYGPQRNPLDWVKKSMVGKSQKFVNMIHVEDLCQILYKASQISSKGSLFIASDNKPQMWADIIQSWEAAQLVKDVAPVESSRISKRIDSTQSLQNLKINLKYPDFSKAVIQGL